jgi:RNA-directed DNA polymerase
MMSKKLTPFDLLCDPDRLTAAWKRVRANRGAPGIDQVSIAEFERDLQANIAELSSRLNEGRYYPMPVRAVEMRKSTGGIRRLGILTVEDRIVQRAALDLIEPLFEPSFLDCSYGFRPGRNVSDAVARVLEYRRQGDLFVVDADIADCFGALDHQLLLQLVASRIKDKRLLALIRMWLDTGQILPKAAETRHLNGARPVLNHIMGYMADSFDTAMSHLLDERGYSSYGYGSYSDYGLEQSYVGDQTCGDEPPDMHHIARKEALKRLGRDGTLLLLTYSNRVRRLLSPRVLALTGAAALAATAYPAAARMVRGRLGAKSGGVGAVQGGSLSPLLSNVYLHEFDLAMAKAGLHLVRYADDFVILCRGESAARDALEVVARRLHELHLRLNPQKTRICGFDAGLEFLGYRFDPATPSASPTPPQPASSLSSVLSAAVGHARTKIAPSVSSAGRIAARHARNGASGLADGIRRLGRRVFGDNR